MDQPKKPKGLTVTQVIELEEVLDQMRKDGFTVIVMKNPETKEEKVLKIPYP